MKRISVNKTKIACAVGLVLGTFVSPAFAASDAAKSSNDAKKDDIEVISITGIRGSIKESMSDKQFASEILDSISAEDIGQLPDENIAEALQRVTGIQMARGADGEGSTIQIRGVSNNNVEINGQALAGSSADRSVNFQDLPSELFSGIEVLKAPTADKIEGSLGGTVNLKTRSPLKIQESQAASVTMKGKYAEQTGDTSPEINAFFAKNWRDTEYGDFGFVVTAGKKEVQSKTEAFGGGDYDDAPGVWYKQDGADVAKAPFNNGDYAYDANVDVNGDGVSDENDVFYVPDGFRSYSREVTSDRDSFNASLQWQPTDQTNFFLDVTLTDSRDDESGSQIKAAGNGVRSLPLLGGDNHFSQLSSQPEGDFYYMDSGRIGGANVRMGGAPSVKTTWRDAEKFTLGGDIQVTEDLNIAAEISTSEGKSWTKQAQLNMGYDWDQNKQLNAKDWAGIIDFDLRDVDLANYTFYESPFFSGNPEELQAIDITSMDYDRLNYFQMQRNADDTESSDDSFRIDATYDIDEGVITQVKMGARIAERSFGRRSYINSNQKKFNESDGLVQTVDIQDVKVSPAANDDPALRQVAEDMQACFGNVSSELSGHSGNLPREWATTTCDSDFFTQYFGMHDIRAFSETKGAGYYENTGSRYDVTEKTKALYLRADFETELFGKDIFGNFGGRYIETDTTSEGYVNTPTGSAQAFEWASIKGDYSDFLPSMNANLALNQEMILRFAYAKVLSRPGLASISPGLKLNFNDELEGYAGNGTAGNPDLDPIRATNIDLSFEWYYSDSSMFSTALFYKDIDSTIAFSPEHVDLDLNGETYRVQTKDNLPGTKIEGLELNWQHAFDSLPGLFAKTGLGANYTYTHEDSELVDQEGSAIPRKRLSEDSYNVVAYYDDKAFSLRLAYNWRSEFVRRENVTLGWGSPNLLPEIEAARGQLDLTANYQFNDNLKFNFSAINLNDSETKRYLKYNELTNYVANSGRRFTLGMVYRF